VVLKHVPAGDWKLEHEGGLALINETEDRIGIDEKMRGAIQGGFLFLHFHGPGAAAVKELLVGDDIFITTSAISGVRIEEMVSP
jgi:hypothetical protein